MSTPTFTPFANPSPGGSGVDVAPRVSKAPFGDGYSQRTEDGLNALQDMQTWVWTLLTPTEFNDLRDFFAERKGSKPFFWTAPDDASPKKFICTQWNKAFDKVTRTMTAKFEQVFDPGD